MVQAFFLQIPPSYSIGAKQLKFSIVYYTYQVVEKKEVAERKVADLTKQIEELNKENEVVKEKLSKVN